jgi:sugar phosphate isomerase/epimerase
VAARQSMTDRAESMIGRLGFNTACLPNRPLREITDLGAGLGLAGIELLSFADYRHSQGDLAGLYFDRLTWEQKQHLAELTAPFEHLSAHAPFWDIAPFSPNPGIREESRRQLLLATKALADLGGSTITTHVVPKTGYELHEYRPEILDFYRELGDVACDCGVTVTMETGWPLVHVRGFADLVYDIDHPAVGANVDVGHLRGAMSAEEKASAEAPAIYNDLLAAHVASLGQKVYHMHLHDIRREDFRDHRGAGRGFIDYPRLMRQVLELDYQGLLVFELEEPDDEAALAESRQFVTDSLRQAAADQ